MVEKSKYNPSQDYCKLAQNAQSVPSFDEYHQSHPDIPAEKVDDKRSETPYSCNDNYQMGSIQDNQIYIATTDPQHDQIAKGEHVDAHGGLSGYFSDQATIDACKNSDGLDNTKYNEACQIAPYREDGLSGEGDAQYKPHIDCFDIDRDALYKNYGTYDFNAAISKCQANNQFGSGGGNQGYNPYISEMIDNGSLKYNPEKSYSDKSISDSSFCNPKNLNNSTVSEADYNDIMRDAQTRSQNCVNNNTPHPTEDACKNGFDKNNAVNVDCNTGHATLHSNSQKAGALPQNEPETDNSSAQKAGTTPNNKQEFDAINDQKPAKVGEENAKAVGTGFNNNGIT